MCGRILGIISCSAFKPSDAVSCDRECVHRLNQRLMVLTRAPEGSVVEE